MIKEISKFPFIEYIEIARPNYEDLGTTVPHANIDDLHAAASPITGNGVIVGIIDTYLDVYHPDFRNNDGGGSDGLGTSRVLFYWDQSLSPNATESSPPVAPALPGFNYTGGASYGTEYSKANIDAELTAYNPTTLNAYSTTRIRPSLGAHGTEVASCAVGNGAGSGNVGGAPQADIIHVHLRGFTDSQAGYIGSDSAFLLDAFAYIFARASALGQACVVNRSGSDNMGPHDGTTLGEQFLDNLLSTTNRAITVAAGNTNNKNSAIQGTVPNGGNTAITLNYFSRVVGANTIRPDRNDQFELWYDGHDRFDVQLNIPDTPAQTMNVAAGANGTVTLSNGVTVTIISTLNDPRNNDNSITIFIENVSSANTIPLGNWVVTLTGSTVINGSFAAWVERNNRFERTIVGPTVDNMTIATPATGLRVISVGAHNADAAIPTHRVSSSCGPTRDGRIKPEITAGGTNVNMANSRNMNNLPLPGLVSQNSGTSFASPLVAGACALIFECRGLGLSWFDLKQILADNAGTPAIGIPSNKFGFGILNMNNGCADVPTTVDVWLRDHVNDTGIEPFVGDTSWLSPDIEVLDMLGNPVSNPTFDPSNFVNNIVRVTARNRSATQVARNVEVNLYWADPGTNLDFPAQWNDTGIYTGDPNFVVQSNRIIIPQIPANGAVQVQFAWAPPAPGANVRGDDHFCLLVRLEHEADRSNIGAGGWGVIRGSNNIALKNTHVVEVDSDGDADSTFHVIGTDDTDTLIVRTENLNGLVRIVFPVEALEIFDARTLAKVGKRAPFGMDCPNDPLKKAKRTLKAGKRLFDLTGITGAQLLEIKDGLAALTCMMEKNVPLVIPRLQILNGAKMPVKIEVKKAKLKRGKENQVHVQQLSGGRRLTGVSVSLVKRLKKSKVKQVKFDGKKLIIK